MPASLHTFCIWLGRTDVSVSIKSLPWLIPAVQTIHITGIAIVMSSIFLLDLRVLNLVGRDEAVSGYAGRFLPWIWYTLPVLLITGIILTIGEPSRQLENVAFQLKMLLLIIAMIVTAILGRTLCHQADSQGSTVDTTVAAKVMAVTTFILWSGIVFAGRWIAYVTGTS